MAPVFAAVAALLPTSAHGAQERPDSVIEIEPVMVRVLEGTIGTGNPNAVSVLAGDELRRGNADAFLEESLRAVPGLQIQNRFNFAVGERLSVRGFGPRAQFGIRGVRVLVDGIPATLPDGQSTLDHLDLSSLGRVELLRGPNATLYGNAAGGVLHLRSVDPGPRRVETRFGTTVGSHGLVTLQGNVQGSVGRGGYRVAVNRLEYDGFRRNPIADDGTTFGGAERWTVNGSGTLPLAGGHLRLVVNGADLDADNPGSLPDSLVGSEDRPAWGFNVASRTGKEVRQGQVGATWTSAEGREGGLELSAWGIRRELENPIPGTIVDLDRNAGGGRILLTKPVELPLGTLSLGAGTEMEFQRDDRLNFDNDGGSRGALTLSQFERVFGAGVFGQARLDLGDRVSVVAGLRWDRIRFSAEDRFLEDGDPDDSGSRTMSSVSPSGGLVARPIPSLPSVEIFASVARSFESPTTTELVNRPAGPGGFNPELDPQTGVTVEGGARVRIAERWRFEATGFRTDLEDELIGFEVPADPGRQFFRNAGSSRHTGWEIAGEGTPWPGVRVRAAYTRVDARFESFVTGGDDFSGNRVPGLAPHRVDALAFLTRGPAFLEVRALFFRTTCRSTTPEPLTPTPTSSQTYGWASRTIAADGHASHRTSPSRTSSTAPIPRPSS